ncbi:hypothetical protein Csa_018260 [Cucumis sativus]|uniref:Uncharacterized protein n=1 Tax=Cucumis sativus TaxID=3659 RepID=A0A0A0K4B0_CUCSA|nr:hypothetical protein Csa_018260 [Cucumis sativus]
MSFVLSWLWVLLIYIYIILSCQLISIDQPCLLHLLGHMNLPSHHLGLESWAKLSRVELLILLADTYILEPRLTLSVCSYQSWSHHVGPVGRAYLSRLIFLLLFSL